MKKKAYQLKSALWLRLFGLFLLGILLWQLDITTLINILKSSTWSFIFLSVLLNIPLVFVKTVRWWYLMRSQQILYSIMKAFLAYFSSIFIGFLTPGRLGELIKVVYISSETPVSPGRAFSTVLVDRLLDLSALILVGSLALISAQLDSLQSWISISLLTGGLILIMFLFLTDQGFNSLQTLCLRFGRIGHRLSSNPWLLDLRVGLKQLSWLVLLISAILTALAYMIFFSQCYLIALALNLPITFVSVSYAVALGSLITLLPISISGIGTRDAAIIAYLGPAGIPGEMALAFSLLVFLVFYCSGGLMGAVAWWLKPVPLNQLKSLKEFQG